MALDTYAKKWSLVSWAVPFNSPIPQATSSTDTTLDTDQKQHLIWMDSAITFGSYHYPREMYDYLSGVTVTPDYTGSTLQLFPHGITIEDSSDQNIIIYTADDNSEERISLDDDPIFTVTLSWKVLSEDDAGILFDFYNDPNKANKTQRSFYWLHKGELTDQHTYVARFAAPLSRSLETGNLYGFSGVKLRVLGIPA